MPLKMLLLLKVLSILVAIKRANSERSIDDHNCFIEVMLNKCNFSRNSRQNVTAFDSAFERFGSDGFEKVIDESDPTGDEELPHHVVPEISNYERGAQLYKA
jgi:hypothetical protein